MNAALLAMSLVMAQADAPPTPEPPAPEVTAPEVSAPEPPAVAPRTARRASSFSLEPAKSHSLRRRVVGGVTAVAGLVLVLTGMAAVATAASIELSPWPDSPKLDEYPRRTLSGVAAGTAAVTLMFGAACLLGGAAAALI